MLLYSYPKSSGSYRVRISLNLKELLYEIADVNLLNSEQESNDYKQINSMQQVPYLVDGENRISQSMAILMYIDSKFSQGPKLFGHSSAEKVKIIELCEIINSGIQPHQNIGTLKQIRNIFGDFSDAQKADWTCYWIHKGLSSIEQQLQSCAGQYSIGHQLTAVDCFLIPQVYSARRFQMDISRYPLIQRIEKHCGEIAAFQKAAP